MKKSILCNVFVLLGLLCGASDLLAQSSKIQVVADSTASECRSCEGNSLRTWWCPDDYRPKRMPCVLPPSCGRLCDDYCGKRMPCVLPPSCGGLCDDYCPKAEPCLKIPSWFPSFYRCPPPTCGTGKRDGCWAKP